MSFVSFAFIVFMALVCLLYFIVPVKVRWVVLLIASYIYIFINSSYLILVLFGQTVITFLFGLWLGRYNRKIKALPKDMDKKEKKKKTGRIKKTKAHIAHLGVFINLLVLLFLKYYNFFIDAGSGLLQRFGIEAPALNLLMPIGISFYTLQAMAYILDVSRNKCENDTNLFKFMLFMSYFPQIVQGPIARYKQLASQLYEGHRFDYQRMCYGIQLILWGFMKKLIIADRIAVPVNQIFNYYSDYTGIFSFLAAAGYGIQVYADFSGGMDIARGFSQIIGIDLEINFRQPYFSKSIEEFWRRWHITLGSWMRDYIFYPMSLSKGLTALGKIFRKIFGSYIGKKIGPFISMFVVYLLVGFWHGPEWKYVAYGIWNGVFIMFGILLEGPYAWLRKLFGVNETGFAWSGFQMIRTFILCSIGRFFSRASRLSVALAMIKSMTVRWYDLTGLFDGTLKKLGLNTANWILLAVMILILFVVDSVHEKGIHIRETIAEQGLLFRWFIYILAFISVFLFGIYGSQYDAAAFIYQQF